MDISLIFHILQWAKMGKQMVLSLAQIQSCTLISTILQLKELIIYGHFFVNG